MRKTESLFVCYGEAALGQALSKQRLARWIVEAISMGYSTAGVPPPPGVVAHSTQGVAASWALFRGAQLSDICAAAGWTSALTFARFYSLDVTSSGSVVSSVLGAAEQPQI